MKAILFILLLFPVLRAGAQDGSYSAMLSALYSNTVPLINCEDLSLKLNIQEVLLLDAREDEEFRVSHIKGARAVGYDNFSIEPLLTLPRDIEIVVYCSVGYRSEKIGEQLIQAGFPNVKNLYGGIFQWINSGLPLVKTNGNKTDSIHAYNRVWGLWLDKGVKVYE